MNRDPYCWDDVPVLRNLLNIRNEEELDQAEAELSSAKILFPALWQVHPFREGNTRTVVMLLTFFVEHHGFYFDQDLMAQSAGYVRDSFVMASLGKHSEYTHLEKILMDAIQTEHVEAQEGRIETDSRGTDRDNEYKRPYKPAKHEYSEK